MIAQNIARNSVPEHFMFYAYRKRTKCMLVKNPGIITFIGLLTARKQDLHKTNQEIQSTVK